MRVTELWRYPVKSLAGQSGSQARIPDYNALVSVEAIG